MCNLDQKKPIPEERSDLEHTSPSDDAGELEPADESTHEVSLTDAAACSLSSSSW